MWLFFFFLVLDSYIFLNLFLRTSHPKFEIFHTKIMYGCWPVCHFRSIQPGVHSILKLDSLVWRVFAPLWLLWLMQVHRGDKVKSCHCGILSSEISQHTFHLSGLLSFVLDSSHTLHPPDLPSSSPQSGAPFCSHSLQSPFVQHHSFGFALYSVTIFQAPATSMHCAHEITWNQWEKECSL